MKKSFQIFERKKGIYVYPEILVYIVFTLILFSVAYANEYLEIQLGNWVTVLSILWFIYTIVLIISNLFRYEHKHGEFNGNLEFNRYHIKLRGEEIKIYEIKKMEFPVSFDVKGEIVNSMISFLPKFSNGTKNKLVLELQNGEEIAANFLQDESRKVENIKEELISYYLNGKMDWVHLLNIVNIPEYEQKEILNGNYKNN